MYTRYTASGVICLLMRMGKCSLLTALLVWCLGHCGIRGREKEAGASYTYKGRKTRRRMRPQQMKILQTPFKTAAGNNCKSANLNAVAALSMLFAPQASHNMFQGGGTQLVVQSKLKQPLSGLLYLLQDQFHSSAAAKKEDNGDGNGKDKDGNIKGGMDFVDDGNNNEDEASIVKLKTKGVRQTIGPKSKCIHCSRPLQTLRRTNNYNESILECSDCKKIHERGSSGSSNTPHEMIHNMNKLNNFPNPKEITAYLDKFVIGQDDAKRALSLAVYEHYIRITINRRRLQKDGDRSRQTIANNLSKTPMSTTKLWERGWSSDVLIPGKHKQDHYLLPFPNNQNLSDKEIMRMDKSNIMILGPSGVGKTYMVQIVADILGVPMAHSDCTTMTQAGYVGDDVESVLTKLLQQADNDVQKAQMGIVFLDEIDKIASKREFLHSPNRDVSGEGVQHAFLKMIEGTTVNVKTGKRSNQFLEETVPIDTRDILFIASGAFTGIEKQISRRMDKLLLGFGSAPPVNTITVDDKEQQEINEKGDRLLKQVQADDVIKFGMIPELVGRFPVRVPFYSLNKDQLKRILNDTENSMLAQEELFFKYHNTKLEVTDDALDEIAERAIKDKTGARSLRSILNEVLSDAKYNLPGSDFRKVIITGATIRGETTYEVTTKDQFRPKQVNMPPPSMAAAV